MIHYHGLPITPASAAVKVLSGRHAFISYAHKEQFEIAAEVCQSFAIDNGAFSSWSSGKPTTKWDEYYGWVDIIKHHPGFDFAVIPDIIDGSEQDNDMLVSECPLPKHLAAPVWHMHESADRLEKLSKEFYRVCIGSSGEFSRVGSEQWWSKMHQAMKTVCNSKGHPRCRLHGLRMLNPKVFTQLPLSSADSTSVGRNIGIDKNWKGTFQPPDKEWRALVLAARFESHNGASAYLKEDNQHALF